MNLKQYGAGLKNGTIKTADGSTFDINAIVTAEGEPQMDDVAIKGDDETKLTFYFNQREEITIEANGLSFDVLQEITGNSYASSAQGVEIALGTVSEQNPPFVEVAAETTAKDDDGTATTIKKIWHKVQLTTPKVTQSGENEFNVEITGIAYPTSDDIEGVALASRRVATLRVDY